MARDDGLIFLPLAISNIITFQGLYIFVIYCLYRELIGLSKQSDHIFNKNDISIITTSTLKINENKVIT